ncbi:MAG: leucine-rich repeat domain-containing protein [Pirellulaceae bacterium]
MLFVLLGMKTTTAKRQQVAVACVEKMAGKVGYDYQVTDDSRLIRDAGGSLYYTVNRSAPLPGPEWLRELVGVDFFVTVVSVNLRKRQLDKSSLSSLANLSDLKYLNLSDAHVSDLSFLATLTELQGLDLAATGVTDLSPLTNLTALRTLRLRGDTGQIRTCSGQVHDLSPLENLSGLRSLDLSCNPVTSLSPLAGLVQLEELDLTGTYVIDLTPLAGLTRLKTLDVSATAIECLSPLKRLTSLAKLDLNLTSQITDLSPLRELTNLRVLNLVANDQIDDEQVNQLREALPNCKITR